MNGEQVKRWIKINGEYFLLEVVINGDTGHVITYWNGIKVNEWIPTKYRNCSERVTITPFTQNP